MANPDARSPAPRPTPSGRPLWRQRRFVTVALLLVLVTALGVTSLRPSADPGDGSAATADGVDQDGADGSSEDATADGASENGASEDGASGDGTEDAPDGDGTTSEPPDITETAEDLPPTSPEATTDPQVAASDAEAALARFLELADTAYQQPQDPPAIGGLATGAAADEVRSALAEFEVSGYRQEGRVQLEEVTTLTADLEGDPPTVILAACIDASAIAIVDADGQQVRAPSPTARSLHHYEFRYEDGRWQAAGHDFPDDADC